MIRIIVAVLCIGFAFPALSQTQPNPFDLRFRPRQSPKPTAPITPKPANDSLAAKTHLSERDEAPPPEQSLNRNLDSSALILREDSALSKEGKNPFELGKGMVLDSAATFEDTKVTIDQDETSQGGSSGMPESKGIQIFFLLLSLLFLIFIVNVERNYVRDLWRVISNENYSSLHLRNQRNTMRQILLMMGYLIFVIQAGMFLYHVLDRFNYQGRVLDNIWVCIVFILVIYLTRHTMIRYLRWLFNNDKEMTLFGFDISIFNITVGLMLLPINVLLNFGPETLTKPLIIIGILIIGLAYFMRQLRWMLTARQLIANSLFLFFVYLCTVEILPLWAVSKFLW